MARTIEVNEIAYTEPILSIYVKASCGQIAFNIASGFKNKDYSNENA
jgi:hypothetical protein